MPFVGILGESLGVLAWALGDILGALEVRRSLLVGFGALEGSLG